MPPPLSLDLRDFSDRLPPVLVKELRQGLRARMFVIPFLVLHGLLMLTSMQGTPGETQFFWHCLAIMLVCLVPSRNLGALGEERQANTLDTLILTRLTPGRIVWGKWCATAAQCGLTAVSALPYLLVRYLNNGTSFLAEGGMLITLLLLSGSVAAVLTALSTIHSQLGRNTLAAALFIGVYSGLCSPLIHLLSRGGAPDFSTVSALAVTGLWAAFFSLWQAASTIAPASANPAAPRRLTSLAAILVIAIINRFNADFAGYLYAGAVAILCVSAAVEMGERPPPAGSIRPRRRFPHGLLFQSGWASGVAFSILMWAPVILLFGRPHRIELLQICALSFFPVTARCLLPARFRFGAATMVLLAILSHILSQLGTELLPVDARLAPALLPSVAKHAGPASGSLALAAAVFWPAAALILAAVSGRIQARNVTAP